ncbi:cobaltochelatase subunit CobN [Reyranella sp.]|jgi:cobaltochelatase CobN|uniref:cobaltochelatase subunit CobN n=1 Tax=Reyranella sp. TaxID=1929291 RepID=UPI000BD64E0B|nr:cobaltochelatase subunit CobN [Reyranella sp.]OYY33863.1 MAG: cobaltochelatase subunit CobN [Rhodospirillales bacterium 35-66-84]OYZ90867.1 MAG: cobaltochelatase subunit CobN [Rhodospirillales bacterium 24-66-33]OZB21190.1 MAG: cobaltochelatase subunit CobN [Rhodospirillales bacterium 39-66-50]HQS19257.1 cobaltochelatase subunit CobN [Reyranella sp.]HQT15540.1 cobaltochelatase subunit CobN [Reyranella sp.]
MHVLATQLATLSEADVAIDLGQSPAEMVVLSFADSDLSALAAAWQQDAATLPTLRLANLKKLKHPMSIDLYVDSVVAHARIVVVRCLGGLGYWRYGFERLGDMARDKRILLAALPGDDRADPRLASLSTLPAQPLARLGRYFREGGTENLRQALRFVGNLLGHDTPWKEPVPVGPISVLGAAQDDRPTALVVFYRSNLLAADMAPVTALMDALDRRGLAPLAVAVSSLKDPAIEPELNRQIETRRPAIVLNATAFSAMRTDDTTILDTADVPVLQVVLSGSTQEAWASSPRGLSPADLAMNVVLPELDGRLLTRTISFKAEMPVDPRIEFASVRHAPDLDRIDYVARLAAAWAQLSRTPRAKRRVALIMSDYPARGGRTGYAVGLDTPASVAAILRLLGAAGYEVGGAHDIEAFLRDQAERVDIPLSAYRIWLAALSASVRRTINEAWGDAASDPAVVGEAFRLPVLRCGNVMVLLQPDRGSLAGRKSGYHDMTCPPRHAYVALYAWLRETEKINALIHLGTHGTLEWLPGKALALSAECWPEAVLGPVPVVYPFIVNNPGEAVQAKRRLAAITIGHLTPPLSAAGLHGALAEMEGIIEEYAAADGLDRRRLRFLEDEIVDRAWSSGLAVDCGLEKGEPNHVAISKLDAQLCDIKELSIRDGLHVFGQAPDAKAQRVLVGAIAAAAGTEVTGIDVAIQACDGHERAALVAALDGRRVAPGPAGAPTRGRADVLPTGRNLTSIDPRSIPTPTAAIIGSRAAEEVVRRYLQDHGEHPRSLVIDLWASASLRTGGDDLAQALAYLGVRPTWDKGSNRITGIEIMPLSLLDRPRIDVTLRISGLFRDVFETQITLFDMAVRRVAELDEEAVDNPLAEVLRRGADLARVFGSAPGSYGAQAADLALDGAWQTREQLGEAYLSAVTHAYGGPDAIQEAGEDFRKQVSMANLLVHPQDDRERDLLDGDAVADFAGGFAAAAALLGNAPELYHVDTSQPSAPKVRRVAEEVARVVRGRLTNPRWLAGMLEHGHRGVAEIAQTVDALYAISATARVVPSHLFDATHEALFGDEAILAAMMERNTEAVVAIAGRLRDALARDLWTTRRNAVDEELSAIMKAGS